MDFNAAVTLYYMRSLGRIQDVSPPMVEESQDIEKIEPVFYQEEMGTPNISACPSPDTPSQPPPVEMSVMPGPSHALEEPVMSEICTSSSEARSPRHLFVQPRIRYIRRDNIERIKRSIQKVQTIKDQELANIESNRKMKDEFAYFGKIVANQLRQLPISDVRDLESEILEIIDRKRKTYVDRHYPASASGSLANYMEIPKVKVDGVGSNHDAYVVMDVSQSMWIPQPIAPNYFEDQSGIIGEFE